MKILTNHFPSYDGRSRREIELLIHQSISRNLVVSFTILTAQSTADGLPFHTLLCSFLGVNFCFHQIPSFEAAFHRPDCPRSPFHPALQLSWVCSALWLVSACIPWLCILFLGGRVVTWIQQATWRSPANMQPFTKPQVSVQCQAKTAGMKSRRYDGDSQVRGKDCQVSAAELPPCPQVWFHPGMWHWCLSDPLEACLSFSVAG